MRCPKCQSAEKQNKIGKTRAGSQRYRCFVCRHSYTAQRKSRGYDQSIREKAIRLYVDGTNLRRIGRQLGVNPQSVANWIKAYAEKLPAAPVPRTVRKAEMDELFTFIGEKKQNLRSTHGRSALSLHLGLETDLAANPRSSSTVGR